MTTIMMMTTAKTMKSMNPIFLSIIIMAMSLMGAVLIFKSVMTSWMAFITVLTFSSGMMTLFMYTASLSANEKMKEKKTLASFTVLMVLLGVPHASQKSYLQTMKTFSSAMLIMVMASILILTLLALSTHGHHPNQTVSSSF